MARIVSKVDPHGSVSPVDTAKLTHDQGHLRALPKDPLHHHHHSPCILNRTLHESLKASRAIKSELQSCYSLPFLALHGEDDTLSFPLGSHQLYQQSSSTDKALKFYPGMFHDILQEVGKHQVESDVLKFIDARNPLKTGVQV